MCGRSPIDTAARLVAVVAHQHDSLQDLEDVVLESTEYLTTTDGVLQQLAEIVGPTGTPRSARSRSP